jgi:hypothetical protein
MVSSLLPFLLFAATASAQVTTTFVRPLYPLDTDKIGYVGSVIAVNNSKTCAVLFYDNGTDTSALSVAGSDPQTMIIGPDLWGQQVDISVVRGVSASTASDADLFKLYCEGANEAAANWTCTGSFGPSIAANL